MHRKNICTEKQIEISILQFLDSKGIFCWKQNTVGVYDSKKNCYRRPNNKYILSGISDILGIYNNKFLAIEVKTPARRKNLSEAQAHFLHRVIESGGIAFVATSIEDVVANLFI